MVLTKWFGKRSHRSPQRDGFFRPSLECLEGRLAPSSMVPMDPGHGHGHGHDDGGDHGPAPIVGPVNGPVVQQSGNVHNNIHITDSFNNATNAFNSSMGLGATSLSPTQSASVGALIGLSALIAAETGSSDLSMLIDDEIALAVDTYLSNQSGVTISSLSTDISTLKAAIAANPLESTLIGSVVGTLAYDVTLSALDTAQATI